VASAGKDGSDRELRDWTAQVSAPVAVWNDERPRSTWIEQLYLAERLAPTPSLIPANTEDRLLMFGYGNEICGESGFAWSKRLTMIHSILSNPKLDEANRKRWTYMGNKYGYGAAAAEAAPARMADELREAPEAVERQGPGMAAPLREFVFRVRERPPQVVVTCARGSSAHAATFAKHLIERRLAIQVAAAAPNIATIYGQKLRLKGQLFLAVSQSGRSDDLIETTVAAKSAGALTVAVVNVADSPLAACCHSSPTIPPKISAQ
jgi:hypothetical protein